MEHVEGCPPAQATEPHRHRDREVRRVFWVTLFLNLGVAVAKGAYGYASGSVAVGADALHSLLDASSNVLALLALHFAAAPASRRHPYGYRKIELVAAVGIGVLIVAGLAEMGRVAIEGLAGHRAPPVIGWDGFLIIGATMVVNAGVTRWEHAAGHRHGSHLLQADAEHTRSDLYASAAVLVSFAAVRAGLGWADGVGGLVLVLLVGRAAWTVLRDNLPPLLDAAVLDPEHVIAAAGAIEGIDNVHRVRTRGTRGAVELDLHMQVSPRMDVARAHELAHRIETELRARFPELADVVIHIEPGPGGAEPAPARRES